MRLLSPLTHLFIALTLIACQPATQSEKALNTDTAHVKTTEFAKWETVETEGLPTPRHEASLTAFKNKLYLIGGRRINAVDVYDPQTNTWSAASKTPVELHHFQSIVIDNAIYLVGAMTGGWPTETPLENVILYYPEEGRFETSHPIPENRRRGGAGVAVYNGKIYVVGGITNGHMNGYVNWFDEYDPKTGQWRVLADAPYKRDHLTAIIGEDKLYVFGGRQTEQAIGNSFGQTVAAGDVFNFQTEQWEPFDKNRNLPTLRAGNMITKWGDEILIGGGESDTQEPAHSEVEAYNMRTKQWRQWPALNEGRHGSGFAIIDGYLFVASGCGRRGGEPELTSLERIKLTGL